MNNRIKNIGAAVLAAAICASVTGCAGKEKHEELSVNGRIFKEVRQ